MATMLQQRSWQQQRRQRRRHDGDLRVAPAPLHTAAAAPHLMAMPREPLVLGSWARMSRPACAAEGGGGSRDPGSAGPQGGSKAHSHQHVLLKARLVFTGGSTAARCMPHALHKVHPGCPHTWVMLEGEGWQVAPHSSISMRR